MSKVRGIQRMNLFRLLLKRNSYNLKYSTIPRLESETTSFVTEEVFISFKIRAHYNDKGTS